MMLCSHESGRRVVARLQLLWPGEDVAVWRYWSKLDGGQARCCGERADWDHLSYRDWTKVEVQR